VKPQSGQIRGIGRVARIRRTRKTVSATSAAIEESNTTIATGSGTGPNERISVVGGFSAVVTLDLVSVITVVVELVTISVIVDVCVLKMELVLDVELAVVWTAVVVVFEELLLVTTPKLAVSLCGELISIVNGEVLETIELSSTQFAKA
jgi:hypothetical protein